MEIGTIDTGREIRNSESYVMYHESSHIYLYCFFKGPSSLSPQKGVDRMNATFALSYRDLCALVSLVPRDEYNEQTLCHRMEDLEWIASKARHHEDIVEYVMSIHPVIPLRFGTIYASSEGLLTVLRSNYDELQAYLDFISDKEEWGVKVYAGKGIGRKKMEFSGMLVSQLDERISSATPGQAYLLRKKRENLLRQHSIELLNSIADRIYQQILSWSVEGRRNKVLSKQSTGKGGDMILNTACLLGKLDVETFKENINTLATSYTDHALSFEISGPWPCYNFCPDFDL